MITTTTNVAMVSTALPIRPVLDKGLIIFAHAKTINKLRFVTLEDPYNSVQVNHFGMNQINKSHTGKGVSLDLALSRALRSFHGVYSKKEHKVERPSHIKDILDHADNWLDMNNGVLRVVGDFDGSVIVRLESNHEQVASLEGYGKTFYHSLFNALNNIQIKKTASRNNVPASVKEESNEIPFYERQASHTITLEKRIRVS